MSDRLSDERVAGICGHGQGRSDYVLLAREVQSSRKLIADLGVFVAAVRANNEGYDHLLPEEWSGGSS